MPILAACWPIRLFYLLLPPWGPNVLNSQLRSGDGGCHTYRPRVLATNALLLHGASILSTWRRAPSPNHQRLQDIVKHQHKPLSPPRDTPAPPAPQQPHAWPRRGPGRYSQPRQSLVVLEEELGQGVQLVAVQPSVGKEKRVMGWGGELETHPGHSFGSLQHACFQVMGANWALIDLLTILQLYADRTPSC